MNNKNQPRPLPTQQGPNHEWEQKLTNSFKNREIKIMRHLGRCDARGAWYKMNGETTTKLKNSHLQNILTSANTLEQSSVRMQLIITPKNHAKQ